MFNNFSDKVKGAVNKAKDKVDTAMDSDKVEKYKGTAQDKFGEMKDKIGTAMDSDKVDKYKGQARDKIGELKDKLTNKKSL